MCDDLKRLTSTPDAALLKYCVDYPNKSECSDNKPIRVFSITTEAPLYNAPFGHMSTPLEEPASRIYSKSFRVTPPAEATLCRKVPVVAMDGKVSARRPKVHPDRSTIAFTPSHEDECHRTSLSQRVAKETATPKRCGVLECSRQPSFLRAQMPKSLGAKVFDHSLCKHIFDFKLAQ